MIEITVLISDSFRDRHMYSFINWIGSALCFRKMIVSIPVTLGGGIITVKESSIDLLWGVNAPDFSQVEYHLSST